MAKQTHAVLRALDAAVDANFDAQVAWLSRFVRFPSLRGAETDCQDWLAAEFAARGWNVDRFTLADVQMTQLPGYAPMSAEDEARSVQLIATVPHGGASSGKSLILQGHVDVVPPGPDDLWNRRPFSGDVADGWLHGRGAQDMKMGISANVFALDALKRAGYRPAAPVFVQTVTEEESTGNGALAALARGCRADACLIPEPTANTITRAQTGAIWFRIRVKGKPVHVARSETGTNAILSCFRLIEAAQRFTDGLNREAAKDAWFGDVPDPVKFNAGRIQGGDWPSSTPAWCDVDCRIGVLPSQSIEAVKSGLLAAIKAAAADDAFLGATPPELIWNGFQSDGAVLEPGSEAEAALARAHMSVFETPMDERRSTAVNDTRYYNRYYGIPGLCYGPHGKGMHGVNERANLENLRQTTKVFARFIADWCGLTAI
jgi:acetylornithine deacetylase